MAQEDLGFIGCPVAIAVFSGDLTEPDARIIFLAALCHGVAQQSKSMAEGIVGKIIEACRCLAVAGKVASGPAVQPPGEKPVVMPFQGRFVGGGGADGNFSCQENGSDDDKAEQA